MKYDLDMVVYMLRGKDWEYRAERMGLPTALVKNIHDSSDDKLRLHKNELEDIVYNVYKNCEQYMVSSMENYQKSWDMIIQEFSDYIAEKSIPWFYEEYICNITHYNRGLSNWNGNVVGRWWKENMFTQRRITAHEILLAHYFSIHRNNYKNSGLSDDQIWALAEIFALSMTGLDKKVMKFWPWDESGYYKNHNYPHIVELQSALEEQFIKRESFTDYVDIGIEQAKKLYKDLKGN